jgi:GWxTD domain-containing protein
MKLALLLAVATLRAGTPDWLARVQPVVTAAEKKAYLTLAENERAKFEQDFWANKAISADEYFARADYVDANYGSTKPGSGANTDQGRVYLALGPPNRVTRIPSSRVFVPLEIWYYDSVPGVLNTELRLIFFQKGNTGFPKLYSPLVDTIRALLLPQASTRTMFGPNDSTPESDIRKILKVGPAEDEVIPASVGAAAGIKYSGNEEILGRIASPREMLGGAPKTDVHSRLILGRPKLDVMQTTSPFGGVQVDFLLDTKARQEIRVEIMEGSSSVYQNRLRLQFPEARAVSYEHRLDLLPGSYRVVFTVDGAIYPYMVEVPAAGGIVRADLSSAASGRRTPFEFDSSRLEFNPAGRYAAVAVARPGAVTWTIRQGAQAIWKSTSDAKQIALVELPAQGIAPGVYRLEATTSDQSRSMELVVKPSGAEPPQRTVLSFNANLSPTSRLAFVGHQWLLRGDVNEARRSLQASLEKGLTAEAQVELARADAMQGSLDAARERVRRVLAAHPDHFQALAVLASIEAQFQDYPVAADLYRRALAIQDSPALRAALAQLPAR